MAVSEAQLVAFGPGVSCDRCSAAPQVGYRHEALELEFLFCGHHSNKLEDGLTDKGFTIFADIRDERAKFNRKGGEAPLAPASA